MNTPPSFKISRSSMKHLIAWKWRACTLSFEISWDMYLFSKWSWVNSHWDINFLPEQWSFNHKIAVLHKMFYGSFQCTFAKSYVVFGLFSPLWNIIFGNTNVYSISTFKKKKKINNITINLLINLSWGSVGYKVLKSCVAIDLTVFFLFMMLIFSMTGSTFGVPRICCN